MNKRKVCIVLTTRGNYAKMHPVMRAVVADPNLTLQLIVGGDLMLRRYGHNIIQKISEEFKIDQKISFVIEGENPLTMAKSAGLAVGDFATAFDNIQPDVVIVIADRYECLPIAMAASYMNIPVAHIEGGEVSGSIDESIRHAISKLSHIHFPATRKAADYIERMGEDPKAIFPVGCTSFDLFLSMDYNDSMIWNDLRNNFGVGDTIDFTKDYLLVIQHPVTTEYEDNFRNINETISAIEEMNMQTVWIWPNMDAGSDGISKGIREFRERKNPRNIHFFKSLAIQYFGPLLKNSRCIVGNSSSGIREASFFGVPSVNIGTRQNGRERAFNVMDAGYQKEEIVSAIHKQLQKGLYSSSFLFGDGKAADKVVEILKNYTFTIQKRISYA
ncbi:MAG: UDP-N-acetylglucosamine 2-epimerase [Desulfobacterales bacterium]